MLTWFAAPRPWFWKFNSCCCNCCCWSCCWSNCCCCCKKYLTEKKIIQFKWFAKTKWKINKNMLSPLIEHITRMQIQRRYNCFFCNYHFQFLTRGIRISKNWNANICNQNNSSTKKVFASLIAMKCSKGGSRSIQWFVHTHFAVVVEDLNMDCKLVERQRN